MRSSKFVSLFFGTLLAGTIHAEVRLDLMGDDIPADELNHAPPVTKLDDHANEIYRISYSK